MLFKSFVLFTTLTTSSVAFSAARNLCDDLIEKGSASSDQIAKCQAKFGESEYYKEQLQKKKWQVEAEKKATDEEARKKENIEFKKFTSADLDEAGFGKPFYAIKVDYRNPSRPKEKRITEGDTLCKYLGFDKAVKSIVSGEIHPDNADKNGLVLDTNFLGMASKEPDLYRDEDLKFTVRKYVELTCAKIKVKDDTTADILKGVAEDLVVLNTELNLPKKDTSAAIDNGPRKPAGESKTPNGYKKPDWASQESSGSVSR
jgi:hypothetical protein